MNEKIKQAKIEFENENYDRALELLGLVEKDDEDYFEAQFYKMLCLLEMKSYNEALPIIDSLISKHPYIQELWFEKVWCHVRLNENDKASEALEELERICDRQNKESLVEIARLYRLIGDDDKALEYCNLALDVDGDYLVAWHEKAFLASGFKDEEMIEEVSNAIIAISDNTLLCLLPVFAINLFSKRYEVCWDILNHVRKEGIEEHLELYKIGLYNKMSEDLNVQIGLTREIDLPVDDAIRLMFQFKNHGINHGVIHGVDYFIL